MIFLGQGERPGDGVPHDLPEAGARFRRKQALWRELARRALPHAEALDLVDRRPDLALPGDATTYRGDAMEYTEEDEGRLSPLPAGPET